MQLLGLGYCLFAFLCAIPAHADRIPGFGSAPFYYYSTDAKPVEISFAEIAYSNNASGTYRIGHTDPVTGRFIEGIPIATVTLPRAYINRFASYASKSDGDVHEDFIKDILPERIVGQNLMITMTYPDGLPYSTVYETWPLHRAERALDAFGGKSDLRGKDDEIRALALWANIDANPQGRARESDFYHAKNMEYLGEFQGFARYKRKVGTLEVYLDDSSDEIRRIQCGQPGNPLLFCEYRFPLNAHFTVALHFVDFRIHGGRAFARERIRAFKKTMCPIFGCDERALRAAEVKGDYRP